jgi:hypothetical protein
MKLELVGNVAALLEGQARNGGAPPARIWAARGRRRGLSVSWCRRRRSGPWACTGHGWDSHHRRRRHPARGLSARFYSRAAQRR